MGGGSGLFLLLCVLAAYCVLLLYLFLEKNHKPKLNGNKHTCKKHPSFYQLAIPFHSASHIVELSAVPSRFLH